MDDIAALTEGTAEISWILYIMGVDADGMVRMLNG